MRCFATARDELGLVALHCSHRGTSLEYGRVEDNGIRCCYHGWLYDIQGNCLEQPAEPGDSTFKERIKHPAYHAQDAAGLIFAYVGPEPVPLLPSYDLLVREDGCRVVGGGRRNLQLAAARRELRGRRALDRAACGGLSEHGD